MRGRAVRRQWQLLVMLRRKPLKSTRALARELGVSHRTIMRDLDLLESIPFPLVRDGESTVTLLSMPEWPRRDATPAQELRP